LLVYIYKQTILTILQNKKTNMKHFNLLTAKHFTMFSMVCLLVLGAVLPGQISANSDFQIGALENETNSYQNVVLRLSDYAQSLQATVSELNSQVATVQAQLTDNQAKLDAINVEIASNQKQIDIRRSVLSANLQAMYIDNNVTPLEVIASKGSLSAYLDKQQYRDTIRARVATALAALKQSQALLVAQQVKFKQAVQDATDIAATLTQRQTEQQQLLDDTQNQQQEYAQLIEQKNADIATLRTQQNTANSGALGTAQLLSGDPNHGGYPAIWDSSAQDSMVDNWGMFNRECVSYTAWKVFQTTGHMPYWGGRGNAREWPDSAKADGIATGSVPKAGAVAILLQGPYGHAMFVEKVNDDGTIRISQYNYGFTGHYSEMNVRPAGLVYIYFQ
jgi:surface antigen